MADTTIAGLGSKAAPLDYTIPEVLELLPRSIRATFDGSGAAASFLPTLQVVADSGDVVGSYPVDTALAAGASADVSWFPRLRRSSSAAGLGVCGETDTALSNPGIYLACLENKDALLTVLNNNFALETTTCTAAVAQNDYVVGLVGIGSVTQVETGNADRFVSIYAPFNTGAGFTANPARSLHKNLYVLSESGSDPGFYNGGAGGTTIICYATRPVKSNAAIGVGATFEWRYVTGLVPAVDYNVGPRCYAVVGIPAAAVGGAVLGSPSMSGGGASADGTAPGFEYLMPAGGYAANAPQDMAHIYALAAPGVGGGATDPFDFASVLSVKLGSVFVGGGGGGGPDPTTFWFDVAVRMHRDSYAGSCFRILVPPASSPSSMPRWSAAGTTAIMATSS